MVDFAQCSEALNINGGSEMIKLRLADWMDREFWFSQDGHLSEKEFGKKVRDKMGYIILQKEKPIGILRYGLFWDSIPFLSLIIIEEAQRKKGYGEEAMGLWEKEMAESGYGMILLSTQVDEDAQHFYRKLGYKECGSLILDLPGYAQPMEMFMSKGL